MTNNIQNYTEEELEQHIIVLHTDVLNLEQKVCQFIKQLLDARNNLDALGAESRRRRASSTGEQK